MSVTTAEDADGVLDQKSLEECTGDRSGLSAQSAYEVVTCHCHRVSEGFVAQGPPSSFPSPSTFRRLTDTEEGRIGGIGDIPDSVGLRMKIRELYIESGSSVGERWPHHLERLQRC